MGKNLFPRVITIANQKGGVGKTTTVINLATALAAIDKTVLIIDLDPQGNASTGLGIDRNGREISTCDLLMDRAELVDTLVKTAVPRLYVSPSTLDLLGVETGISQLSNRAYRLKNVIERYVSHEILFDFILIDCPPSLNLLTINAMTAASALIVPLQCEFFALEGLSQLLRTVDQVNKTVNPDLTIYGIVLTMFDSRNNLSAQVGDDVRKVMGDKVYKTVIPRNVRISEAPSYGKPAILYDLECSGSQAYLKLASEVIKQEKCLLKS